MFAQPWRAAPRPETRRYLAAGEEHLASVRTASVNAAGLSLVEIEAQQISGGRFRVGLGVGAEQFLGWAGLPRPGPLAVTRTALAAALPLLPAKQRPLPAPTGWNATAWSPARIQRNGW